MKFQLVALLFIPLLSYSQSQGINFESALSWKEIQAKAKAENKYIFMDCYASWCGPCKWMAQNIFTKKEVGNYYNTHFINVAVQIDQTKNDSELAKKWYDDAKNIEEKYSITSFPTYLFFSPDGKVVHRHINTTKDLNEFIAVGEAALNPEKQYYNILYNINERKDDSISLMHALQAALDSKDISTARILGKHYLNILKTPFTKQNLEWIIYVTESSKDSLFTVLINNFAKFDEILQDPLAVEYKIAYILYQEKVANRFLTDDQINWESIVSSLDSACPVIGKTLVSITKKYLSGQIQTYVEKVLLPKEGIIPDWSKVSDELKRKVYGFDFSQLIEEEKPKYFLKMKMYPQCAEMAILLLENYGKDLGDRQLNNVIWNYIFMHSKNPAQLKVARKWGRKLISLDSNSYNYLDTYANLLYKSGFSKKAIRWESKAIVKLESAGENSDPQSAKELKENLLKMTKGQKTWVD